MLRGQVLAEDIFLDNGDADTETKKYLEYSTGKAWSTNDRGNGGTQRYSHKAYSPNGRAMWRFFEITPGSYEIYATWSPLDGLANDAPYFVFDGPTMIATVKKDQKVAPQTMQKDGVAWESIGTYAITQNNVSIILSNSASSYVAADSILLRPARTEVTTSPAVCGNSTVEAGEQCDDGNTASDDGCSESCTIENTNIGIQDLELSDDFDRMKVILTNKPGTPVSVQYTLFREDSVEPIGGSSGDIENQTGEVTGLSTQFEKSGTGLFRLEVSACVNGECSPVSTKYVSYESPLCFKDEDCGTVQCVLKAEGMCALSCSIPLCKAGMCSTKEVLTQCTREEAPASASSSSAVSAAATTEATKVNVVLP